MTIYEIKQQLTITQVLAHYHLTIGRNNMMHCPFHEDEKPSMKVYPETNTVYCFAGTCDQKSMDVIDFIMKKERGSKHQAILLAKSLVNNGSSIAVNTTTKTATSTVTISDKKSNSERFNSYRKSFKRHPNAQAYCDQRALDGDLLDIGYKSRKAADKWGRACIIFPLRNAKNDIISLYGRSIVNKNHYYQSGRSGLYPSYPKPGTKRIILTESIIDAASLQQLESITQDHSILALYGTNGLTSEHQQALKKLPHLEEITFFLDGDEAGQNAVYQYAMQIQKLLSKVRLMNVVALENEDINSILQAHLPAILVDMVAKRQPLKIQNETLNANIKQPIITPTVAPIKAKSTLNTEHPHNLIYTTSIATYFIKGGVRFAPKDLDSLKITLVIQHQTGRKSRNKVDLYEDKQVEKLCSNVGEKLGLRPDLLELDLHHLVDELEKWREKQQQKGKLNTPKSKLSPQVQQKCLAFLKQPDLLKNINQLIAQAGVVGEENNRLLLFVVASSYAMSHTLHALIQGSSGTGKTRLLKTISDLMPPESIKRYTRVTDGSFYNQPEYFFTHKLLCFEDIDGLKEDALLAVRELQSNEILITSTSIKDENGSIRGGERIVRGPIASLACTTKAELYEDNISRCFVVAVDESQAQSLRIIQYQNNKAAGIIDAKKERQSTTFLQNCMRLIKPMEVINPFANKIHLPKDAHKIRRLNELYQSFVRQITLLHQHQRKTDSNGRLLSQKADLQLACQILFESIVLKVDELDGSLRQFFERLKVYIKKKCGEQGYQNYEFSQREVRQALRLSKSSLQRYIQNLLSLEYLKQYGFMNRGYRYRISFWDDNPVFRQRIQADLNAQLALL